MSFHPHLSVFPRLQTVREIPSLSLYSSVTGCLVAWLHHSPAHVEEAVQEVGGAGVDGDRGVDVDSGVARVHGQHQEQPQRHVQRRRRHKVHYGPHRYPTVLPHVYSGRSCKVYTSRIIVDNITN